MKLFATLVFALAATPAFAAPKNPAPVQPQPQPQAECSGEMATPIYNCFRQKAGVDIRLYVQEYQTCTDGKITQLDRSISGLYNADSTKPNDVIDIEEPNVSVTYGPTRTQIPYIVDTSFNLPTSATITTPDGRFDLALTTNMAPDFDGAPAEQSHYVGSYTRFNPQGQQIEAGELSCFIIR